MHPLHLKNLWKIFFAMLALIVAINSQPESNDDITFENTRAKLSDEVRKVVETFDQTNRKLNDKIIDEQKIASNLLSDIKKKISQSVSIAT